MAKIDPNEAKVLEKAIKSANIAGKNRKRAWEMLRKSGLEAALEFVDSCDKVIALQAPVPYAIWGEAQIDRETLKQMDLAAQLPVAVKGALMPDAHVGYGLPIGGVLATDNAIIPYAVGVDIACRMRLTIFDANEKVLAGQKDRLKHALLQETRFGAGAQFEKGERSEHAVLDDPNWQATAFLRGLYQRGVNQLGSSGGGNHFVEWGLFSIDVPDAQLGIEEAGTYLALLSHSGSRGVGYAIANHYSKLATSESPGLPREVQHLAWIALDSGIGPGILAVDAACGSLCGGQSCGDSPAGGQSGGPQAAGRDRKSSQFRLDRASRGP